MDLYIFGAGQIADVIGTMFREFAAFEEITYVVDEESLGADYAVNGRVIGWDSAVRESAENPSQWFTAIGYRNRNSLREQIAQRIANHDFDFASLVHPSAQVASGFELGRNVIIMENNVVQRGCRIGDNSIVWSSNHLGHHTSIGRNTFIASEVCVSGSCEIGDNNFFGVNATVFDNLRIGDSNIIGASTTVRANIGSHEVVT